MSKARLASDLEHAVLLGVAQHKMYREIAESHGVTKEEVRACAAKLAARLGCSTKLDLMERAQALGYGGRFTEPAAGERSRPAFTGMPAHQSQVLEALVKNAEANGAVPMTYRELTEASGLSDPRTTSDAVHGLARRGLVKRQPHCPRSLHLVVAKLNPLRSVAVPA
ncbi:MarR family transcriptional regulator (plasmid) [Azospirillum baldaniorum]|uniref:LexA repressor DNA-binding domain-containing protein n=1 Tax=Azospirillum baldaniorum TaxID=1064539 RepID=A0A9P1NRA8_9PROT|nr:helix-turn-helix domain-containing protein [Azospirillum baldaniorum]AWJ93290.1 MarR family transcriptional regulator [Azospirillum baldaniorum]TWA77985.1 LexA DNA binding domain-containing protein [Azospirillum brasilense]CCD02914.1 protein of unknown function [Azospirillum baldaniorum]